MASVEAKDFATAADEVMTPSNARVEMVNVGGQRVMKLTAQPGWKWSTDIKPMVGTESCEAKHIGVIVEGSISCRHDDGTEVTYSAGSAYASNQVMTLGWKVTLQLSRMNFMAFGATKADLSQFYR